MGHLGADWARMLAYVRGSKGLPGRRLSQRALDIRGRQPTSSHFVSIIFFYIPPQIPSHKAGRSRKGSKAAIYLS